MDYALYNLPDAAAARAAADAIIDQLLQDMRLWGERYRHVGALDTASQEAFAAQVVFRLRQGCEEPPAEKVEPVALAGGEEPSDKNPRPSEERRQFMRRLKLTRPADAIVAMIRGLRAQAERNDFNIDMTSFGRADGGTCFGCAATCTLMEAAHTKFTSDSIGAYISRARHLGVCPFELELFEEAIDSFRAGHPVLLFEFFGLDAPDIPTDWAMGTYNWENELPKVEAYLKRLRVLDEPYCDCDGYDHDCVRCELMMDIDCDTKAVGETGSCCACLEHDCEVARAEREKHPARTPDGAESVG